MQEQISKPTTAKAVIEFYEANGVSAKRIASANDKFEQLPKDFKVIGLTTVTLNIAGKELKGVPAFLLEGTKQTILVGTMKQSYTTKQDFPSIIKADNGNKGKLMIVNNRFVHELMVGKTEAEMVAFCMDKEFHTTDLVTKPVYTPEYDATENKPIFYSAKMEDGKTDSADNYAKTKARVLPKDFTIIVEGKRPE